MHYNDIKESLLSTVDTGLKYAGSLRKGVDFEIFLLYEYQMKANIAQGNITVMERPLAGVAVRAAKGNKIAFSSSSSIDTKTVKSIIQDALHTLDKTTVKDDKFQGFCDPQTPGKDGHMSDKILELDIEDLIIACQTMVNDAQSYDPRVSRASVESEVYWRCYAVGNTQGVLGAARGGYNCSWAATIGKEGDLQKEGFDYTASREKAIDPSGIGVKAAKMAISQLDPKTLDSTGNVPTIWLPDAAAGYISASLKSSALGYLVAENRSYLSNRLGEKIASDAFTLIDDGQDPSGLGTYAIDAEGLPQKETIILDHGVLKNYLLNSYNARILGLESTGNCEREGRSDPGYEVSPSERSKFLRVKPGSKSLETLLASIDGQAIMIELSPIGIFHSSVATGEFSCVLDSAYLVEDGEVKYPLKPVSIGGNFYKGLKNLRELANDVTLTDFRIETPTFVTDGFTITG